MVSFQPVINTQLLTASPSHKTDCHWLVLTAQMLRRNDEMSQRLPNSALYQYNANFNALGCQMCVIGPVTINSY